MMESQVNTISFRETGFVQKAFDVLRRPDQQLILELRGWKARAFFRRAPQLRLQMTAFYENRLREEVRSLKGLWVLSWIMPRVMAVYYFAVHHRRSLDAEWHDEVLRVTFPARS